MSQTPTIGFSAFLKIINSNPKPQKRIVRERYVPSEGGYDYHKSLRQRIRQIAFEGISPTAALASVTQIKKSSERESAKRGLLRFFQWRDVNPGPLSACDGLIYNSPRGLFKVNFTPDFLLEINGRRTAVHVWNTKHSLTATLVLAALSTVATRYPVENRPDDFAVLSLQDGSMYRWSDSDKPTAALGEKLLELIDRQCELARFELGLPAATGTETPRPRP
ncbi:MULTISPECIES: hypothetical protein [unclassified Ensifer]|uniref:hypothetical protein n=1 Tax=unclassified Ensifer TaxID=2633371 RepID=UPI000DD7BAE5|nr:MULTISPECIES: hypothetical protein [unclassified Ensifer]MBD9496108.1 hypothetical protein [Ensifer sp. ENS01]MBD9522428.1 hypothetical protein [Ensifer sp. ENS02]